VERLRVRTAGESHGPKVVAIVDGLPAGLQIDPEVVQRDLSRRQAGYGRGLRMRKLERDRVTFSAGLRFGETFGAPLLLEIPNLDHAKWTDVMSPDATTDRAAAERRALTRPRPGHADLVGGLKYGRRDLRDVLERASARSSVANVAAGAVARVLLASVGVRVFSMVLEIGDVAWTPTEPLEGYADRVEADEGPETLRCPDAEVSARMRAAIDAAREAGDTLGGRVVVVATGVPAGLGSYASWDAKLDGRIAQAVMSVPAVKAVELGLGVEAGRRRGSAVHDPITFSADRREDGAGGFGRASNHAGGLEGGITTGQPLVVRATMKPISTLAEPLPSVDLVDKQPAAAAYERSDTCAVPACGVIAEAQVMLVLADAVLEAFGGDTVDDLRAAHAARRARYATA
jgi:chorismate synthase